MDKYFKHWLSFYCDTHNWLCLQWNIKSLFKSWVIIFAFPVFWVKNHYKSTWKFRIRILIPILFNISVLLDVQQANMLETSLFLVCPNSFDEHLFSNVYSSWELGCITLLNTLKCVHFLSERINFWITQPFLSTLVLNLISKILSRKKDQGVPGLLDFFSSGTTGTLRSLGLVPSWDLPGTSRDGTVLLLRRLIYISRISM